MLEKKAMKKKKKAVQTESVIGVNGTGQDQELVKAAGRFED